MSGQSLWLDSGQKDQWHDLLEKLGPDLADVYFDPEYGSLYENDKTKLEAFAFEQNGNVFFYPFLVSAIPQAPGFFDIRTPYGYGGPVSNSSDLQFLASAHSIFYPEVERRGVVAELVKFHPLLENHEQFSKVPGAKIMAMGSTVCVDMDIDEEERWADIYTHANRKNINKSRRAGVQIFVGQDEETWCAFQNLYRATMEANRAQSFYFFSDDYYSMIRSSMGDRYTLVSAKLENRILAVLLVLLGPKFAHCHLTGSERDCMSLGVNNHLYHELIGWCRTQGYKALHMGGGRTNDETDGLLKFKMNFSNKTREFHVGEKVVNADVYASLVREWEQKNPDEKESPLLLRYRT